MAGGRGTTTEHVLELLLKEGPMTVRDIQETLGLSSSAVRLHLDTLYREGLVTVETRRQGVGRPVKVYKLTPKARGALGRGNDALTISLLREVIESEGPEKTRQLLSRVSTRLAREYKRQLRASRLWPRVQELRDLLRKRGVVADIQQREDTIYIYEYTCPYHEVAQEHRLICEMEERFLREVLDAPVTLHDCMVDGAHKCIFAIKAGG